MAQVFFCILLLLSFSGTFCKYFYINKAKSRSDALSYCRQNYIDLAPVSNEKDNLKLMELYPGDKNSMWFGLGKNSASNKWMWSGGGEVTWSPWDNSQPDNANDKSCGVINKNGKWQNEGTGGSTTFFCYGAVVVQEKKTWEEALEYCRKHHDDLASVASDTEMLLIQTEMKKYNTTEPVWIGLRFLAGDWLWVDGQEMDYEPWGPGGKPSCPHTKTKCAGLQVTAGSQGVWMAHDCEEKLNFVCY